MKRLHSLLVLQDGQPIIEHTQGGQLFMVIPSAGLTIVTTSDPRPPSSGGAYIERQRTLAETLTERLLQRSAARETAADGTAAG